MWLHMISYKFVIFHDKKQSQKIFWVNKNLEIRMSLFLYVSNYKLENKVEDIH
jgi:hypothetical protein